MEPPLSLEEDYLPLLEAQAWYAGGIVGSAGRYLATLKNSNWRTPGPCSPPELALATAPGQYRRGVQAYSDQVEAGLAVLGDGATLERITAGAGTSSRHGAGRLDPKQFAGARRDRASGRRGARHLAGRRGGAATSAISAWSGDGQQAIYGSRADIDSLQRHRRGRPAGRRRRAAGFRRDLSHPAPAGSPPEPHAGMRRPRPRQNAISAFPLLRRGGAAPLLQVPYGTLVAGPLNEEGAVGGPPLRGRPARAASTCRLAIEAAATSNTLLKAGDWRRQAPAPGARSASWRRAMPGCWRPARSSRPRAWRPRCRCGRTGTATIRPMPAVAELLCSPCVPDEPLRTGRRRSMRCSASAMPSSRRPGGARRASSMTTSSAIPGPLRAALETLRPFPGPNRCRGRAPRELCRRSHAGRRVASPGGPADRARRRASAAELERLLAQAAELGLAGAGPRAWRRELLAAREAGASGRQTHRARPST